MITVAFFAALRELVGTSSMRYELNQITTTAELFDVLASEFSDLERFRKSVLVSVNEHYADWETPIQPGDSVAFFPPVSGGNGSSRTR